MDPIDAIRETFFEECGELLQSLEAGLLSMQAGTHDADTIDAIFRAVHSIKGGAGAFGLSALVSYAHALESALDALRTGALPVDPATTAALLGACDRLGDLVGAARAGGDEPAADTRALDALVRPRADGAPARPSAAAGPARAVDPAPAPEGGWPAWSIAFEPLPGLFESGNEPLHLFRALQVLGDIDVVAEDADLPALDDPELTSPRLRWRIVLHPSAPDLTETEIEAVFEFAISLCILDVRRLDAQDAPTEDASDAADDDEAAPAPPRPRPPGIEALTATIRVDLTRVDRLVDLVGELVICQSMLSQAIVRSGADRQGEASQRLDELQQLTRDMQDGVMAIRAQPIRSLFQRMTRIVREAAQQTGKTVRLEVDGEATEIDKTVVERLADPLVHMIRNAIDHGIETPEVRRAAGKPPCGVVRLSARQRADRVVVTVADDGGGIDRARVRARAEARGLVLPGRAMADAEIDRLMFLPGFSTTDAVSAMSGRGVGLDVVQQAVRDLSGTVSVSSSLGRGSEVSVSLPITLAILEGMIVRCGAQRMVLPLSTIMETQTAEMVRFEMLPGERRVVRHDGRVLPYVDLAHGLGFARDGAAVDEDAAIIVVRPDRGEPFALGVDGIEMHRQVVIKGLTEHFGHVPCVSAATILGDGQVALIIDPVGIAAMAGLDRVTHPTPFAEAI